MKLSPDEYLLFSRLYNSLLKFVDEKLTLEPTKNTGKPGQPNHGIFVAIREALFKDRQLIDTFVKENPCKFSPEDLEIVSSWKHARVGDFYMLRSLKQYTVFVGCTEQYEPSEELFGVLALDVRFKEIVKTPLPAFVRTALLPFQGKIIFDGLMSFYEVDLGTEVRQMLNGCYKYAKAHSGIITTLVGEGHAAPEHKPTKPKKPKTGKSTKIKQRLEEVMDMIPCPVAGCWSLHGAETAYYYDRNCECHALEVWPVGFEEPVPHSGNGHKPADDGICYEFAEFEFCDLVKEVPLEHFHFSQRRQVFEIGWKEGEQELELRIHLVPKEVDEE